MANAIFVMGSGTEVGKTFVACQLVSALCRRGENPRVLKPVATGVDPGDVATSDAGRLLAAAGGAADAAGCAAISPWSYAAPISPHLAARAGRPLSLPPLLDRCRAEIAAASQSGQWLVIESAGGILSPLDDDHVMLDWAKAMALPVLLVGDSRLGALTHLLAAEYVLAAEGVAPFGIVVSESGINGMPLAEQQASIARLSRSGQMPFVMPRLPLDADSEAPHAAGDVLLSWLMERLPK